MAKGDHIYVKRGLYDHHGIDAGGGWVIHYTGEVKNKSGAAVRRTRMSAFSQGGKVDTVEYGAAVNRPDEVLARATSRLGEATYDLAFNNCEHFARWCKCGTSRSVQIDRVAGGFGGPAFGSAATAAGIGLVSAGGTVAGLSGSGVMSGLAAAGATVGGGAVAGLAALGAAPAVAANVALRHAFKDDPADSDQERAACQAARIAGVVGSVAGTGGAIAAVSGMGTVAGLSGAGITTGLAAVGGTVGGGMLAGTAMAVAAPAVAAGALAYGTYRLVRWTW
jgi:hypothetical protein